MKKIFLILALIIACGADAYSQYALYGWGANDYGQLGDGTTTQRNTPTLIGNSADWKQISAGQRYTVAIKSDGTLWAWGYNTWGQLGDGTTTNKTAPTQIGTDNNWALVQCGLRHTVAIKSDGTLWAWGYNSSGQIGDGTMTDKITPTQIGTATNWASVSCGHDHNIAIKNNGTLWAWGANDYGQLGDGTTENRNIPTQIATTANWASVTCGDGYSIAIKSDGTLWAWGYNYSGQLGDGTTESRNTPTQIGTSTNWSSVSCGQYHTVAIKSNGTLWAWGYNEYGQLGDGTSTNRLSPSQIGTAANWSSVSCGQYHTVAIKSNGTLWAWGSNGYGQIGNGTTINRNIPILISNNKLWLRSDASSENSYAIYNTNTLKEPQNMSVRIPNVTALRWNKFYSSTSYRVQVSTDANFNTLIRNAILPDSVYSLTGLNNSTKYYWRVKGFANNDSTEWTDTWHFYTASNTPRIFVKSNAAGLNNGSSWANAFTSLQNALDVAYAGDSIFVAGGTYKPSIRLEGNTNRYNTFPMKVGVSIYGGYSGSTDTAQFIRDINLYETVLSGDIGIAGDSTDNVYHIVTYPSFVPMDTTTRLDGLTLAGGNANADNPDNKGGAILLNNNGSPLFRNCTFRNNSSTWRGGAIYNVETAARFELCKFYNNSSTTEGGAIYNYYAHNTLIDSCSFAYNRSGSGGALYCLSSDYLNIKKSIFGYNSVNGNVNGTGGGAIYTNVGRTDIINCNFTNNIVNCYGGANGGGAIKSDNSINTYSYCNFMNNQVNCSGVDNGGGGVYGNGTFNYCNFTNNQVNGESFRGGGGGILGNGIFSYCSFTGNQATVYSNGYDNDSPGGGAILGYGTFINCILSNNSTNKSGGGINGYGTFLNCTISNNHSTNKNGGGINGSGTFLNCTIGNNTASQNGGGINGYGTFTNCIIRNNIAATNGGGIYSQSQLLNTNNCTISDNNAQRGGGIYTGSSTTFKNSILYGNSASVDGDEFYKAGGSLNIYNSCYGNNNGDMFGQINDAANNINLNPQFADPANGDYRILGISPCVDAGNNEYTADTTDIRGVGFPRKLSGTTANTVGTIDIGAYEFNLNTDPMNLPPLAVPSLISPSDVAVGVSTYPQLKWHSVPAGTAYRVQVSRNANFSVLTVNQVEQDTISVVEDLLSGTVYYWRVCAKNAVDSSLWSAVRSFTTLPPAPLAPTLVSPSNNATSIVLNPSLSWNQGSNATSYRVQVSTSNTFNTLFVNDVVNTNSKALSGLANSTQYYWRVCSKSATDSSAWSSVWSFTTLPPAPIAPTLVSPSNNATSIVLNPSLSWNQGSNATSYRVQVSTSNTFNTLFVNDVVNTNSKALSGLANSTQYYWRVCSKSATDSSAWSSVWSFTTLPPAPLAPTLLSPSNNATSIVLNPTLSWNTVANSANYRVQVATDADFSNIIANSKQVTNMFILQNLSNSANYFWRVRAFNNVDSSAWSPIWTFRTQPVAVPASWAVTANTGNFANVGFQTQGNFTIGDRTIERGDAVGVFYTRGEQKICAGYLVWGDLMGMAVWGDNDQTQLKDGFAVGETYTLKVWDGKTGSEYPADYTVLSGNNYYSVNGISVLSLVHGITHVTQTIPLASGWNLISGYVMPNTTAIQDLVFPISSQLTIMKNANGLVHWPGYITSLTTWDKFQAYFMNVTAATELSLTGQQIKPEQTPIQFANAGWYWMPYFRTSAANTEAALSSIGNNFSIVKAANGETYWPGYMNTLSQLEPHKGYMIYMTAPANLTYSANSEQANGKINPSAVQSTPMNLMPDYSNTGNSATLAIEIDGANSGDEFGVYTADGLLVGSAVYSGKATGVNIWGDNDLTAAKDGATENETLIVKLFNSESNSLSAIAVNSVSNALNGEKALTLQYNQNAVTLAKGDIAAASAEDFNSEFSISPQPVRNEAIVTYNVENANAGISIELYDLKGTIVATYNFTSLSEGTNKLRLDVSNIPSGMYNAVIKNGAEVHNAKLIKVD